MPTTPLHPVPAAHLTDEEGPTDVEAGSTAAVVKVLTRPWDCWAPPSGHPPGPCRGPEGAPRQVGSPQHCHRLPWPPHKHL